MAENLGKIKVGNRRFIQRASLLHLFFVDSILPRQGRQRDLLEQYVGEAPIVDFVHATLATELHESQEYDPNDALVGLSELKGYSDLKLVASRLVANFESLPWEYTVSVPMPQPFGEMFCAHLKQQVVSDSIRLVTPDETLKRAFPLTSGIERRDQDIAGGGALASLLLGGETKWEQAAYLQFNARGFIGRYAIGAPYAEEISTLKAFCGLGIALRLFTVDRKFRHFPGKVKVFIHRKVSGGWSIEQRQELDATFSEIFQDLVLHDLDGSLETDPHKVAWMRRCLEKIGKVFSEKERAEKIVLAAQWLLDSYCGDNELLSFVQASVVLEILLGDKVASDLTGLGELLANRCAYLISGTHSEREEILEDFRSLYAVRSSIVHRGKSRLSLAEHGLFSKLRWMCRRVIQEEVELLEKDQAKGEGRV